MDADERGYAFETLTESVIGCAFKVSNTMGVGSLEKVYENALAHEIRKVGLTVDQQVPVEVRYDGVVVVENQVVIELKHAKALNDAHLAQSLNYLKATGKPLALLLNFGTSRLQVKRVVLTPPHQ